jgi:excisionase family DNA binding protein
MRSIDGVEMLDVREAADLARRTPETIRRWVWGGRLEATKEGNRLLVRRSDITALATPGEHAPETPDGSAAERLSLGEWASRVRRREGTVATAADLVWDDRAGR